MGRAQMIGTLSWAKESGGRVNFVESLSEVRRGVGLQLWVWGNAAKRKFGFGNTEKIALREVELPETAIARETERLCRQVSTPWLVNHCLRTYVWGELFAARDGISHERELLYCAALLHDLGITQAYPTPPGDCFALAGARAASDFLRSRGLDEKKAQAAAEAIALHLNVKVGIESGPEAHLLSLGVGLDVIGLRIHELPEDAVQAVLMRHPRVGMKREVIAVLKAQAKQSPKTRIALLCRHLQFISRVRRAPFAE